MAPFPARLHVLLARSAPLGVIIRRGPAHQVCTLLWDRHRDQFHLGQWLKGRIYERRCDVSPDGTYMIYFAMNGRWQSEVKGAWTAISRTPYLKAVAVFPQGNCWYGGGLFTDTTTYWFNAGFGASVLRDTHELQRDPTFKPMGGVGGECLSVYYPRLLRDGWTPVAAGHGAARNDSDVFEKQLPRGWVLRKIAHAQSEPPPGKGCYWDEHALLHPDTGAHIPCPDWEWADRDSNRLVWTCGGKLMAGHVDQQGLTQQGELVDLNAMTFERIEAPY